jgi:hypothetical protein
MGRNFGLAAVPDAAIQFERKLEAVMKANSIFKCTVYAVLLVLVLAGVVAAQNVPTVRFVNYSGEDATVKLSGPTGGYIEVPNGESRTVSVRGGSYSIVTRYGRPGNFSYQRGDQFSVSESAYSVDRILITLHKVPNGNYHTRKAESTDF